MNISKENKLITIALFSYNQEKYIQEAVEGALKQIYFPLEIIISDDHSTDQTFVIIKKVVGDYTGKHKVIIHRNQQNLGICQHVNKIIAMASGNIIIMSAGDDVSFPRRSEYISNIFEKSQGKIKGVFSNALKIDGGGNETGLYFPSLPIFNRNINDFKDVRRCWVLGATFAFDKIIFSKYGEMQKSIQEDGILAFRAILEGEIEYIDEPLVKYRHHGKNVSDPNDATKRLYFQKSKYLLHESWLIDAIKHKGNDKKLIKNLKQALLYSRLLRLILMIPLVGLIYNQIIVFVRNIIKNPS